MISFPSNQIEKAKKIAHEHGATSLSLFGSFARGNPNANSDIDFLVEMKPHTTLFDIIAIKQDLEELFKRPTDVLTKESLHPYIREEILHEAVQL